MPYHQQQPFDFSLQQPTSNFAYPFFPPEALIPFESYDPSSSSNGAGAGANGAATGLGDMDLALLNSPSSQEQREHEERMTKQWESAGVIEDDLNGVHSRIHSLAEALGLDPVLLDNGLSDHAVGVGSSDDNNDSMDGLQMGLQGQQQQSTTTTTTATGTNTGVESLPTPSPTTTTSGAAATADFDFDSFFNNLSSSTAGLGTDLDSGMDYTSTAFLDEVPTPASSSDQTASPVLSLRQEVLPEVSGVGLAKGSRKRKSDVAIDLDIPGTAPLSTTTTIKTTSGGGGKSKRKRDK